MGYAREKTLGGEPSSVCQEGQDWGGDQIADC